MELRPYQLSEITEITGNEKLIVDNEEYANALTVSSNKLASWILSKAEAIQHAECLYFNDIAPEGGCAVGDPFLCEGGDVSNFKVIGICLDAGNEGDIIRVAYAGKVQVMVHASIAINKGDIAGFRNTGEIYEITVVLNDEPYSVLKIMNIVGIFLEDSAAGEDRLVWVKLKL